MEFCANEMKEALIAWIRVWFEKNGRGCNAVNHYFYSVLFVFVKCNILGKIINTTVYSYSDVSALFCVQKHLFMHTLLLTDNRRKHHKASTVFKL